MTRDEEFALKRYHASVEEVESPDLDDRILAAAHRQVVHRRVLRVSGGVIALLGIVLVSTYAARVHTPSPGVTNYGAIEGVTRAYLLQVQAPAYARPGINEGR